MSVRPRPITEVATLGSPGRIGPVETANRVVMSPLTSNYADSDGYVSDQMVEFYRARARGGVGLVVVEGAIVSPEGRGTPMQLMADTDDRVPGLRRIAEAVHAEGVPVLLQLLHHGRQTRSELIGTSPIAPSAIRDPLYGETPREMTHEDIEATIGAFVAAAKRGAAAGFDGVEIHAAHGYLITNFLSPSANLRDDEYGGSLRNRARLLLDLVAGIRDSIGPARALVVRLSGEEGFPEGIELDETEQLAEWLEAAGVDAIDVSAGTRETHYRLSPTAGTAEGVNLGLARALKQQVGIPVIVVGTLRSPHVVDSAIREGDADFAALGRALIADADWAAKASSGRTQEIMPCIGCNVCAGRKARPEIRCPVNPFVGHEAAWRVEPAARPAHVVVHGSGLAGLEAARVAALRGHRVTVLEPSRSLGGLSALRARTPLQEVIADAVDSYARQLHGLGVEVRLHSDDEEAEWSSGSVRATAAVDPQKGFVAPGFDTSARLWSIDRVLAADEPLDGGWLVRGDSLIAAETAGFLAAHGRPVTLLAQGRRVATDTNATLRHYVEDMLDEFAVDWRVDVTDDSAAAVPADHLVGDWRPVSPAPVFDGTEAALGDDFNPSVLINLTEGAAQWALKVEGP